MTVAAGWAGPARLFMTQTKKEINKQATLQMADIKSVVPLSVSFLLSVCVCLFIRFFACSVNGQTNKTILNKSKTNVKYVHEVQWLLVVIFRLSFCPTKWPIQQPSNTNDPKTDPTRNKCTKSNLCPSNFKMIDFSIHELPSQCFFLICFATPDLQNHMNRIGNNTKQIQKAKQIINHNFKSVRLKTGR